MNICFVLVNQLTKDPGYGPLTSDILTQLAVGLGAWLSDDVAPVWGGTYECRPSSTTDGSDVGAGESPFYIVDDLSQVAPGAAAFHDRLPDGRPVGYAAADEFQSWLGANAASEGIGHEFAEVVGDPPANFWADRLDGTEEAKELCDRLQGTPYTFNAGTAGAVDIAVPNFLYPPGFDPGAAGPWDKQGVLTLQTGQTPGGYVILRQQGASVQQSAEGLTIVTKKVAIARGFDHSKHHPKAVLRKKHPTSRTYRRGVRLAA